MIRPTEALPLPSALARAMQSALTLDGWVTRGLSTALQTRVEELLATEGTVTHAGTAGSGSDGVRDGVADGVTADQAAGERPFVIGMHVRRGDACASRDHRGPPTLHMAPHTII
jgi:hypothetical protein